MTTQPDDRLPLERLADAVREMQAQRADVDDTLDAITRVATATVPGAEHAGISLIAEKGRVISRAPTSPLPRKLDELQEELGEGPCLRALRTDEVVRVEDVRKDPRWPEFARRASELGIRSILAFQLYTHEESLGALNLYSTVPAAFGADSYEMGIALATNAAIALIDAQRQSQWRSALVSRDLIGQAKGMLMERYKVDAVQAFALLTRLSQDSNTPVALIARAIVRREPPYGG